MHQKKGKAGFLMFKIDFEKAYDRVDWNFPRLTRSEFVFPEMIVDLIMSCVTSLTLSLKWDGEKLESFTPNRGLRQGDPMSPYLFLLCMEKLALLIQATISNNQWKPINIPPDGPAIFHLVFVENCLLFTRANSSHVKLVNEVIQTFRLASGMKINAQKSRFFPSKYIPRSKVAKFERTVSFSHTYNIGRYLGFPMLQGRVTNSNFSFILYKVNSCLAGWKSKLLSRPGREILAKLVEFHAYLYYTQYLDSSRGV